MKRELVISLCILSMCVGCGDDEDTTPLAPAPEVPSAPRTGLVAEYRFSGDANDTSGNGNNGTVSGATLVADRFGNAATAYDFDGVDDVINTTEDDFANGNLITVSLWMKVTALPASTRYIVMCSDFGIFVNASAFGMAISVPGTNNASGAVGDLTKWHHLLATYDGTNIISYIDGVLVEVQNHPGDISDLDRPLTLGFFSSYFDGSMDDVRIYDRVITDTDEIYALYHEGGFRL